MTEAKFIHMNGALVPYADAKVHIQAPGMKFGIGVFEGVRGYWNAKRERDVRLPPAGAPRPPAVLHARDAHGPRPDQRPPDRGRHWR